MAALLFFRPHAESSAGFGLRRKDDFIWRQAAFAQSADEQVCAPDYFRDSHFRVVGDAGQLVAWNSIATPDDKVSEIDTGHIALWTETEIVELDGFAIGHTKAPIHSGGVFCAVI